MALEQKKFYDDAKEEAESEAQTIRSLNTLLTVNLGLRPGLAKMVEDQVKQKKDLPTALEIVRRDASDCSMMRLEGYEPADHRSVSRAITYFNKTFSKYDDKK